MSTDTKLSKVQLSKIIQSGGLPGNIIDKLGKEALTKFTAPLAKDIFPHLVIKTIDKFEENKWVRSRKSRKRLTLSISNEDMGNIIKIIKSKKNQVY